MQKNLTRLLKNKPGVIGVAIVIVLIVFGLYKFLAKTPSSQQSSQTQPSIESVQSLSSSDVGLTIEPHTGNKCSTPNNEVRFTMSKTADITHAAWQVTYDADIPQTSDIGSNSNGQVTQEIESDAVVSSGQPFTSHYEFLGTCSKNICRCDTGVKKVHYTLNITKNNGKHYKVEADKDFSSSSTQ